MGLGFTLDFLGIEPNITAGFVKYIKKIGRTNLRRTSQVRFRNLSDTFIRTIHLIMYQFVLSFSLSVICTAPSFIYIVRRRKNQPPIRFTESPSQYLFIRYCLLQIDSLYYKVWLCMLIKLLTIVVTNSTVHSHISSESFAYLKQFKIIIFLLALLLKTTFQDQRLLLFCMVPCNEKMIHKRTQYMYRSLSLSTGRHR